MAHPRAVELIQHPACPLACKAAGMAAAAALVEAPLPPAPNMLHSAGSPRHGITAMEQLKTIQGGAKAVPTFSAAEMERRLAALRAHMDTRRIDACLFTSYHNIAYFSDFLYCAFGRPFGLVVTQEGQTTITPNVDGGQPGRRTFGGNLVYTDWHRDNYFAAVKALIPDGRRVGVEFDHLTVENFRKLQGALPTSELVDAGKPAMAMRMVKSAEEIAWITEGARIADIGGAAAVEAIAVGVPEHEVALRATQAMVREIARSQPHVELMDTWSWLQSGPNSDGAHNPVTSRRIERGDIMVLNCFPMMAGYYAALERTLFAETCSDEHLRLWNGSMSRSTKPAWRSSAPARAAATSPPNSTPSTKATACWRTAPSATATASACSPTITAARPGWSCARTWTPCWSPAWCSQWSR